MPNYFEQVSKNKLKVYEQIRAWAGILVGCSIMAIGYVLFINPYNIVPGGVYGASIVLHNIVPSIQVGTFGYMFDIPLLILSVIALGTNIGTRTIFAALTTPLLMNLLSLAVYPDQASLERLDPQMLLGGCLDLSDHLMLTTLIGSVIIGIGCGVIVKCQATSGGSDIVAMIIQKYMHMKFSIAVLLVDSLVVLSGLLVIGLGIGVDQAQSSPSIYLSIYSLIAIFVISRVLAYVINGAKDDKILFVISDFNLTELHNYILNDLDRTATLIKSSGLYTHNEKEMLFLVISYKEVANIKSKIRETDPRAFVVVTDAYDTFGEGWKQLPNKSDIQPE